MNSRTTAAVVIAVVLSLLGGLAWWQLSDRPPAADAPAAPSASWEDLHDPGLLDPLDVESEVEPGRAAGGVRVVSSDALARAVSAAGESGEARSPTVPPGVVTGAVTGDGRPVTGVRVTLHQPGKEPLLAVTDDEGRFRFEEVPRGVLSLIASHDDYAPRLLSGIFLGWNDGKGGLSLPLVRELEEVGVVEGTVTGADGQPQEGVVISVQSAQQVEQVRVTTDSSGWYRIPRLLPGGYRVSRLGDAHLGERTVTIRPGEIVRADFGGTGSLRGVLRGEEGLPLGGHSVSLVPVVYDEGWERSEATTADDGTFAIAGAGLGLRRIWVRGPQSWTEVGEVVLTGGEQVLELDLPGVVLHGSVIDTALGAGIRAPVMLLATGADGNDRIVAHGFTDRGGEFAIHGLPPGRYILEADHTAFEPFRQEIELPKTRIHDVYLTPVPVGSVLLTVTDAEGRPLEGCIVNLDLPSGKQISLPATRPGPGRYRIWGVPAGRRTLWVWRQDLKPAKLEVEILVSKTIPLTAVLGAR